MPDLNHSSIRPSSRRK